MYEGVTVREAMTRDFLGVSEGDPVAGVAELMVEAAVDGAVVLRGTAPVGWLDARRVVELVAAGRDGEAVTAGEAVDGPATIEPDSPLRDAVATLVGDDRRGLVVTEGEAVVGTLSERDVLVAQATMPEATAAEPAAAVATTESGGDDRYSTQSVCEGCGSLAESLASVNGQLLCADCREL